MTRVAEITHGDSHVDAMLRIRAEFCEMPGLTLTLAQASRLFQLDAARCQQVLTFMVSAGQLVVRGNTFLRTPSA
jgi:hypothetical protein